MPLSPSNSFRTLKQSRAITVAAFLREDAGELIDACRADGAAVTKFYPRSTISAADLESNSPIQPTQQVKFNSMFEGKLA